MLMTMTTGGTEYGDTFWVPRPAVLLPLVRELLNANRNADWSGYASTVTSVAGWPREWRQMVWRRERGGSDACLEYRARADVGRFRR